MQGFLSFRDTIARQGRLFAPIGNARVSAVDIRDIAMVAATALTEDGHQGKIYGLTGPEALTHQDMAQQLADVLHRPIKFVDVPPQAMRDTLGAAARWNDHTGGFQPGAAIFFSDKAGDRLRAPGTRTHRRQ